MYLVECVHYGCVSGFSINDSEPKLECSGPPILFENSLTCLSFWYFLTQFYPDEKFLIFKSSGTPVDK